MAENSSQVVINDIPEELKPYRKLLLNAAASQIFTPEYLKQQIPGAQFPVTAGPQQPLPQLPYAPPVDYTLPVDYAYSDIPGVLGMGSSLGMSADGLEKANRVGYAEGGLGKAAEEIERMILSGDVVLGPSGTPLGGYTPPMVVSPPVRMPGSIGAGVQAPPPPMPPSVTPPYGSRNGVIDTQPSGGGLGQAVRPGGAGQTVLPGGMGGGTAPMFVANQPANFAGAAEAGAGGYNPAQYADDSVAQGLARQMGGGVVYTNTAGPNGPPSQAMIDAGGSNMHNAGLIADIEKRFANDEGMKQFALQNLRDEIRSYGGSTGGFAKGGIVKLATGGFPDAYGAGTTTGPTPTPWGSQQGALNPYVPYGSQRVLGMGDQGQVGPGGLLQASNLTRNAYSGFRQMPSYFSNGSINEGRDANGNATTPLGIAGDTFQSAGQLALDASMRAGNASYTSPLKSSFGGDLARIAQNPMLFQAGDISLGELTAPQMDQPLGVGTNQLTSYQMAGPRFIDASGSGVNADQIDWGKFTDPGVAEEYMSPYMRNVMDVQKAQAERDFADAKGTRNVAAIRAGSFGGNRQAVADSIADRDNQNIMARIEAEGNQAAYENAQGQYERDRGASMTGQSFNVNTKLQGDLANQRLGYDAQFANQQALQAANMENLRAALGVQELGANQYMQSQLANQQAGLTAGQANLGAALQSQNLGRTSGLSAAQANQQTRLSQNMALLDAMAKADQLGQQADQGNFTNQMSGMNQQTNSALAANTIGQNRADLARLAQAMELQMLQQQQQAGAGIDARTQAALDLGYQDWTNQQNYPYQQMNWYQSMLAGSPMGYNQEGVQFQKTNPWGQVAGLGTAALGAYGAYQGAR